MEVGETGSAVAGGMGVSVLTTTGAAGAAVETGAMVAAGAAVGTAAGFIKFPIPHSISKPTTSNAGQKRSKKDF